MTDRAILRSALAASAREDWAALSENLGLTSVASPLDFASDAGTEIASRLTDVAMSLHRVGAFERGGARAALWVAVIPEWGDRPSARERFRRRIARALVELAPAGDRNVLIALTSEGVDDIELVLPRQRANGQLGTVRAIVSRSNPNRHHLELLEALVLAQGMGTAAITRKWNDAFSVERVTDAFYKEFRLLRDRFVQALAESNPGHPLLDPAEDDETAQAELRRFVTRNLGRVLFLWFIQAKGWLDSDTSYLVNLYGRTSVAGRNYFTDALLPLFFDSLAVELSRREDAARELGDIPYLNGGLFIPTAVEDRLYGEEREHVDVAVPNELFDPRTHDGGEPTLLGLLSSYRFTTQESTPDDLSVDPDPELLGKVFENLNEDRKKTGTYYTPREIVRFMCREALDGYLVERTGVTRGTLEHLRLEAIDPAATDVHLTPDERALLEEALLAVTVCDPAVGSGAFPVGMLQEIVQLLIGIEQSTDVKVQIGGQKVAEWKEAVITNCLYGVDINPEAVEICQLRLWLSMVVDAERPVPLPNLDFRFEAGDSLVDRVGEIRLRETLPRGGHQDAMLFDNLAEVEQELEALRDEYATVRDSVRARELRREIKRKQLELVRRQISDQLSGVERTLTDTRARLDQLKRMGAGTRDLRREEKAAAALVERHEHLREVLDGLSPDAPYKKPFLWPVEFPEVFEQGGFDVIVANPPYVRGSLVNPVDEIAYNTSYGELVETGRSDLLLFFFARARHIGKHGCNISMITSNKWMSAKYGVRLRQMIVESKPRYLIDFGDLPVFDAAAYPVVVVYRNGIPGEESRWLDVSRALRPRAQSESASVNVSWVREQVDDLESLVEQHGHTGELPLSGQGAVTGASAELRELERRIEAAFEKSIGDVLPVRRGLISGANDVFLLSPEEARQWSARDPQVASYLRPLVRGVDLGRWQLPSEVEQILFLSRDFALNQAPASLVDYLQQHRDRLERRATVQSGAHPWYQLTQPQVGYVGAFASPKIVWADISKEPTATLDADGVTLDSTCYFVESTDLALLAWLNTTIVRFLLSLQGSSVRGNYQRWKSQWVSRLPFPAPGTEIHAELRRLGELGVAGGVESTELDRTAASCLGLDDGALNAIGEWVS